MVTPLLGGLPSPINSRGRAALGKVVLGRVRIEGRLGLMRDLRMRRKLFDVLAALASSVN